jgi:PhnB protein
MKKASRKAKKANTRRAAKPARKAAAKKTRKAARKVAPVPRGYRTVTPHLVIRDAAAAIEFYRTAFGAEVLLSMPAPNGTIAHAELQIGDSRLMLADEMPEMGATAPPTVGGSPVHIFLYIPDVDRWFARATGAGAKPDMPPTDMFWGDRYAKLTDPFGHKWAMATHVEELSAKEIERRGAQASPQPS